MFQIRTVWTGVGGVPYYTTLNFAGTDSQAFADSLADLVTDAWNNLDVWIHSSLTWTVQPQVNFIDTATGDVTGTYIVTSTTGTGSDAADRLPHMAQGMCTWLTGEFIGGRQVKGRTFIPGPTEISNGPGGLPSTPYRDNLTVFAQTLTESTAVLNVWSRTHLGAFAVNGFQVGSNWAYLSSRRD